MKIHSLLREKTCLHTLNSLNYSIVALLVSILMLYQVNFLNT